MGLAWVTIADTGRRVGINSEQVVMLSSLEFDPS
jgi:hypothetical protein